jgi:hypothetical protein
MSYRGNPRGDLINGDSPPLNRINIFPLPVDLMRCNGSVGHAAGELARSPAPFLGVVTVYLSPATTRTKNPIRLHQVWRAAPVDEREDDLRDRDGGEKVSASPRPQLIADDPSPGADQSPPAIRITA